MCAFVLTKTYVPAFSKYAVILAEWVDLVLCFFWVLYSVSFEMNGTTFQSTDYNTKIKKIKQTSCYC